VRQRFAMTERDEATGLDHTWFRKYDSYAGRWTSPDPYGGSMSTAHPQSFNRYAYVQDDPINFADPSGLDGLDDLGPPPPPPTLVPPPGPLDRIITDIWAPFFPGGGLGSGGNSIPEEGPELLEGAGPASQNPGNQGPNADDIQRDFYSGKYGKMFNDCLGDVFGKDAPAAQTLANAPALNTAESAQTLKKRTGAETIGRVVGTIDPPKKGKGGGIYISEGIAYFYGTNAANNAEALITYGHELAVLLDYRINPKGKNGKPPGQIYGKPSTIDPITNNPTDPDTGQAMEDCIGRKPGNQ
jgi:RHS repeat-associated protein